MKRLIAIIIYIINENDNNDDYSIIYNNNNNNDNDNNNNIDSELAPLVKRLVAMLSSFAINHYIYYIILIV